jgi:hypothetical protein
VSEANLGRCRSCSATVVWVKTSAGKAMPCDPELFALTPCDGPVTAVTVEGETVRGERLLGSLEPGTAGVSASFPVVLARISHFATCPNAARHRKAKGEVRDG